MARPRRSSRSTANEAAPTDHQDRYAAALGGIGWRYFRVLGQAGEKLSLFGGENQTFGVLAQVERANG
jgi:hypothetical protein